MSKLWQRGLRQYKFIDRTFNLKLKTTLAILDFFLERLDDKTFLHFELIPDHLPDILKEKIQQFPKGSLQFEIGIQSFNPQVQSLISRKQNNEQSMINLEWLRKNSPAHLHTDLIFGLPGEDLNSFAEGFNALVKLNPHEIQVGILKRLRGTPIIRHTEKYEMLYTPEAPYHILQTNLISYKTLQAMIRFARYWDLIANSGRFTYSLPLLLAEHPFQRFWELSEWLYQSTQQTHRIALPKLFNYIHQAGIELLPIPRAELEEALLKDYQLSGQKGKVPFSVESKIYEAQTQSSAILTQSKSTNHQQRQKRHLLQ